MRKKGKLYTANRWNQPAFMPEKNLFWPGGEMLGGGINPDVLGGYKTTAPGTYQKIDWSNPTQRAAALGTTAGLVNGFSNIANQYNPFEKIAGGAGGSGTFGAGTLGGDLLNMGAGVFGGLAKNAISGGLSSGAGEAIGSLGSTVGGMVGKVNPIAGAAVTFGSNVVGGAINAAFGKSVDEKRLKQANEDIAKLNSFKSNAATFDEVKGPEATASVEGIYDYGFLNGDHSEQEELEERMKNARLFVDRSIANNVYNLANDQLNNALANYSAFGGPIDTYDMGALEYGLMTDFLNTKRKKVEDSNKQTNLFAGMPSTLFDLGGDIQTHGSRYSVGKVYDVSEKEANRLKALGYEFTVVS